MLALSLLALTAALLIWSGVRSLGALAQMLVPMAFAIVFAMSAKRASSSFYVSSVAAAVCIAVSASGMARVAGSLWFPASYALLYACITVWNHGLGRWRIACVGIVALGAAAPWLLEAAGVSSSQYVHEGENILILPDMVAFIPFRTEVTFGLAQAVAVILTSVACFYFSRVHVAMQRRLQLMAWHLRGLAPNASVESQDTASTQRDEFSPVLASMRPAEARQPSNEDLTTAATRPDA
jgi:hypothetical protein